MKHDRNLMLAAAVILVGLYCGLPAATAVAQGPPADVNETFTIEGICDFPVLVELRGKAKTIELSGGRTIFTSPALTATLTNLDQPANRTTMGITGAFHQTIQENGDVEFVVTGRNLLIGFDPEAALVLAIGRFRFVFDADFNLIQPVSGDGQLIDMCALLE